MPPQLQPSNYAAKAPLEKIKMIFSYGALGADAPRFSEILDVVSRFLLQLL